MANEVSLNSLPRETQEKIMAILGKDTIPGKPISVEEALPQMDITDLQKKQILAVLKPENKQQDKDRERLWDLLQGKKPAETLTKQDEQLVDDHKRLERILNKDRRKPSNVGALDTIRKGMDDLHGRKGK
jgi:hypothetical protein